MGWREPIDRYSSNLDSHQRILFRTNFGACNIVKQARSLTFQTLLLLAKTEIGLMECRSRQRSHSLFPT